MSNSAIVGILRALLTLDSAEFEAASKRAADSAKGLTKELTTAGRQATQVGAALTKTLTVPILGIGVTAAKLAMDFESSFAGVRKTIDATDEQFAQMANGFRELAKTIPVNVNELNRLGEAAGALGIPREEVVEFSRVMAMLGVTTNVTADQAAESIAKIQTVFGAAGKDTERFASTLVDLGNNGASTESEILSLATRIASAGNTVGMTQAQVLGFASAIANVGMEAEAGGSAMSRVINDLSMAVSTGGSELEMFARVAGMSSEQFAAAFKDNAAKATEAFLNGLARVKQGGGDLNATLIELGQTELRQSDLLRRLAGSADNVSDSLRTADQAWRANSALTEEARKRFETTAAQLTLLWNRIKDVGITLGNALLPGIKSLTSLLTSAVPVLEGFAKFFGALPGPIQAIGVAFVAMVAAAGPAIYMFGQLALSGAALTGAFTKTGLATTGLAAALGTARAAIPTFAATLSGVGSALALSATQAAALSGTLTGLGYVAALAGSAFLGWQVGRWIGEFTGATDAIEYMAGRVMGLSKEHIQASQEARRYAAALLETAKSLDALAAKDQAGFANALEATRAKAVALAKDLPLAVQKVQQLGDAVLQLANEGRLTPSVLREVARQAESLEAAGATLPPQLQNIVSAMRNLGKEAPQAGDATERTGRQVKTFSAELKAAQAEIDGLSSAMRNDLVRALQSGAFSMEELEESSGLSERALKVLKDQVEEATKKQDAAEKATAKLGETLRELESSIPAVTLETLRDFGAEAPKIQTLADEIERLQRGGHFAAAAFLEMGAAWSNGIGKNLGSFQFTPKTPPQAPGADGSNPSADNAMKAMTDHVNVLAEAFGTLGQASGGALESIVERAGHAVAGMNLVSKSMKTLQDDSAGATDKVSALVAAGAAIWGSTGGGSMAENIMGGAMAGAALGVWGAAAGAAVGFFRSLGAEAKEARAMLDAFLERFGDIEAIVRRVDLGRGPKGQPLFREESEALDELRRQATAAGLSLDRLFAAQGNADATRAAINELIKGLEEFDRIKQMAGRFGPSQEQLDEMANDARATFEYMRDSGVHSAEQIQMAWEELQDAQRRAAGDTAMTQEDAARKAGFKTREELQKTAVEARKLAEYMRDSGQFTAEQVEEAFKRAADAAEKASGQMNTKAQKALDELKAKHQSLADSIADEAPEAVMGVIEAQTRAQMAVLEKEIETQERELERQAKDHAKNLEDELNKVNPKDIRVNVHWDVPPFPYPAGARASAEAPEATPGLYGSLGGIVSALGIQHFARGGMVMPHLWPSRGTDIIPAMLTPGEAVLTQDHQDVLGHFMSQAVLNSGGSTVVMDPTISRELASLRGELARMHQDQPKLIARAVRDEMQVA